MTFLFSNNGVSWLVSFYVSFFISSQFLLTTYFHLSSSQQLSGVNVTVRSKWKEPPDESESSEHTDGGQEDDRKWEFFLHSFLYGEIKLRKTPPAVLLTFDDNLIMKQNCRDVKLCQKDGKKLICSNLYWEPTAKYTRPASTHTRTHGRTHAHSKTSSAKLHFYGPQILYFDITEQNVTWDNNRRPEYSAA